MNRILQFLIFIFWSTLLYSKNIVIDGVTFSADGSILIKFPTDKFYKEYIIPEGTKIIGKKAFAGAQIGEVTFPTTLTHINDSAFYNGPFDFILTGKFPIIGNRVWSRGRRFVVTESNPYCRVSDDNFVYSKDGKTVYIAFGYMAGNMGYVEIIDRYTFQDCYFAYGINAAMYAIVGILFNAVVIDKVLTGYKTRIKVYINSRKWEGINDYILNVIVRGSTLYEVKGGFNKSERVMIETILTRPEYIKLMTFIKEFDNNAFVNVATVSEVSGEGFSYLTEENKKVLKEKNKTRKM